MSPLRASLVRDTLIVAVSALFTLGCGEDKATPTACGLLARSRTAAIGFDANSDGVVDVADGAWLLARNFRGGDDPPCLAAVEAYGDAVDDSATGYAIWYALISGTALPTLEDGACAAPEAEVGACGDGAALSVTADASVSGAAGETASFSAEVQLVSPELPVEAWSVSVEASGCTVTGATLDGTLAADLRDDPPGARDGGLGHAAPSTAGGAVSLVVLDPIRGTTVSPSTPTTVLTLQLSAPVGSACADCVLRLRDGQQGAGRALTNTLSSGGRSYAPETSDATVSVCAG